MSRCGYCNFKAGKVLWAFDDLIFSAFATFGCELDIVRLLAIDQWYPTLVEVVYCVDISAVFLRGWKIAWRQSGMLQHSDSDWIYVPRLMVVFLFGCRSHNALIG